MKVAILNDTHCGVRNSSDIFLKYQERFYEEVFFPYLKENNIKNILHLGDYYEHRKFVNFKALNANRKHFLEPMRDAGITMDIIPGNHDVYFKNTNELCSLKELLGYFTTNVNIVMKPTVLDYDGLGVGCLVVRHRHFVHFSGSLSVAYSPHGAAGGLGSCSGSYPFRSQPCGLGALRRSGLFSFSSHSVLVDSVRWLRCDPHDDANLASGLSGARRKTSHYLWRRGIRPSAAACT